MTAEWTRTLLRCVSSKRFSAAVFLSLLTIAGDALLLPAGEDVLRSSSHMTASSSLSRCVSVSSSLSFDLLFDFFFLLSSYEKGCEIGTILHLLLHDPTLGDPSLQLERAAGAKVIF